MNGTGHELGRRLTAPHFLRTKRGYVFSYRFDDSRLVYIAEGPIPVSDGTVQLEGGVVVCSYISNRDGALRSILEQLELRGW